MTNRFTKRLGVLLAASVGVLLFAGAFLALVPDQRDHERSTQYSGLLPGGADIGASLPSEFAGGMGTIVSAAAFLDYPWIDRLVPGVDRDKSDDSEQGDDCSGLCCGLVCHAAVGDIGKDTYPIRPPSAAVPSSSPNLLGRNQDTPERPPRVA